MICRYWSELLSSWAAVCAGERGGKRGKTGKRRLEEIERVREKEIRLRRRTGGRENEES